MVCCHSPTELNLRQHSCENLESHILEGHTACIIRVEATSVLKMEAVSFSTTLISTCHRDAQIFKKSMYQKGDMKQVTY